LSRTEYARWGLQSGFWRPGVVVGFGAATPDLSNLCFTRRLKLDVNLEKCHPGMDHFGFGKTLGLCLLPPSVALRHSQRNTVGSELVAQAKVQASASGACYPGATRQWLPRLPSCECNSDEQFRSIAEIASAETRTRRRLASYGHDLHARKSARTESALRRNLATQFGEFWTPVWTEKRNAIL
jgi:hypothetical protein